MMFGLFSKKTCLMCGGKIGKIYTTIKYRYENEKVDDVYICEECSKEYDIEGSNLNDKSV